MITFLASVLLASHMQDVQLPHHTFETSDGGWTVFGEGGAKVSVTHDTKHVKTGGGSLLFNYNVAKGSTSVLMLPIADGSLAKMKSLKFWLQSDYPTTVAVMLQEKGGGRYIARFAAPKAQWQKAEIALADFTLGSGPDDPKDPDNKLDPDQIEAVAIIDVSQFFVQGDGALAGIFGVVNGPHEIYLSDFQAVTDALPDSSSERIIDTYSRPQVQWVGLGSPTFKIVSNPSIGSSALQMNYQYVAGGMAGAIRSIAPGSLAGVTELSFRASAVKPVKLMVQLEESGGGKYNMVLDVPGGSTAKDITVALSDLKPANDSKDSNGKLDADQVNQILLIDLTGAVDQSSADNSLWVGKISTKK